MVSWIASGSLRAKMAVLLGIVSILPLGIVTGLDWSQAEQRLRTSMQALLDARSDQVVREIDAFHRAYQPDAERLARFYAVRAYSSAVAGGSPPEVALVAPALDLLAAFPASDDRVRGAALLDRAGRVVMTTETALAGLDLSGQPHVRAALRGASAVVSEIHMAVQEPGEKARIAYLSPVLGLDGRIAGVAVLWVRAAALWQVLKSAQGLAGPGSYAVVLDARGIRVGHSASEALVFHPAGRVEPSVVDVLESQGRFGPATRGLLNDVQAAPEQFERARAPAAPDPALFLSAAPDDPRGGDYGVARRSSVLPWTVVYCVPRAALDAPLAALRNDKVLLAGAFILLAYGVGLLFVRGILHSLRNLMAVTTAIAGGNLEARMRRLSLDELGRLGQSFNTMAARIQAQTLDLQRARDMFDTRVQVRTAELQRANHKLEAQAAERRVSEEAIHEGQELLQAIVDHTNAVIHVKDLRGRYQIVNRRFLELRAAEEDDILGKTDHDFYPPDVAESMRAADQRAAAAPHAVFHEEQVPQADGVHDYVVVKCPLRDRSGRVYGVCSINTDMTELRRAAARLQRLIERLNLLDQVTGLIGERQDVQHLYPVALGHLEEHLPLDFACVCRCDAAGRTLVVGRMSMRSAVVAAELALSEQMHLEVDSSVLWRGVHGELVHEADLTGLPFPFPQRLVRAGLHALVVVPLYVGSDLLGVLLAARRPAHSFSGGDCDFLCQFGTLIALAMQPGAEEQRQGPPAAGPMERLRVVS